MNSNMPRMDCETRLNGDRNSQPEIRYSIFGFRLMLVVTSCLFALPGYGVGFKKKAQPTKDYLAEYVERVRAMKPLDPEHGKSLDSSEPLFGYGKRLQSAKC